MFKRKLTYLMLVPAISLVSNALLAQDTDPKPAKGGAISALIEEVRVTARRKGDAEALQDVPVAVSAFSGDQLEAMFAEDMGDIAATVPNARAMDAATFPSYINFFIRGMGVDGTVISDDPAVGVFVDGVYMGVSAGILTDTFDLEAAEILRGPQGTLFGRNVTGGAAILRTRRPTEEFSAKMRALIGNEGRKELSVAVSGPLVEDQLLGKVVLFSKQRDDLYKNIVPGGEGYGELDQKTVRGALTWMPHNDITAHLIVEHGQSDEDPGVMWSLPRPGSGLLWEPSTLAAQGAIVAEARSDEVATLALTDTIDTEWSSATVEVNWTLGEGELKSITGWREFEQSGLAQDFDFSDFRMFEIQDTLIDQQQFSQEFVYSGNLSDSVNLTTGIYYFQQEYDYQEFRIMSDSFGFTTHADTTTEHSVAGIFGQLDIAMSDQWNLTLGGRFSKEKKEAEMSQLLAYLFSGFTEGCPNDFSPTSDFNGCIPNYRGDKEWSNFTPKLGIQYLLSDSTQFYGSWSRGFRSGGFGVRLNYGADPLYNEETVNAYEVGFKTDLMDGHLRLNSAYFYNEYDDLQRTVLQQDGSQVVDNAAQAVIQGLELEAQWLLADNLLLQANAGYMDAEIVEYDTGSTTIKDKQLAYVPHWSRDMSLTYDLPVMIGTITLRATYHYEGESESVDDNTGWENARYENFNASVSLAAEDGDWRVSLYGNNLTDKVHGGAVQDFPPFVTVENARMPRTYGLEFNLEF